VTDARLRRVHPPGGGDITPAEVAAGLYPAAEAPLQRPYLLINMVSSADGKIAVEGRSGPLGNEGDKQLFHALRTRVDAVMVGAGTLRAERYGRIVRDPALRERRVEAGLAADPLAIVVSGSLALSGELPLFRAAEQEVVVITSSDGQVEGASARVDYLRSRPLDLAGALGELRGRGVRSILCEGGPTLNSALLAQGVADELFLTLSPLLVGGAHPLTAVAGTPLPEPARMRLLAAFEGDDHLHLRYGITGA